MEGDEKKGEWSGRRRKSGYMNIQGRGSLRAELALAVTSFMFLAFSVVSDLLNSDLLKFPIVRCAALGYIRANIYFSGARERRW